MANGDRGFWGKCFQIYTAKSLGPLDFFDTAELFSREYLG